MADATRDGNFVPGLVGTSNDGLRTAVPIQADPVTGRLLVNSTGAGVANQTVTITGSLPSGGNTIGSVTVLGSISTTPVANQTVTVVGSLPSGGNTIGSVTVLGSISTTPAANQTVNLIQINGVAVSVNAGTSDTGTLRVTLANGSNTIGTVTIGALSTGSNAIGTVAVSSIQGALPPGTNLIGSVAINGQVVNASGSNDIGTVTIHSIPTGANAIGTVAVSSIQGALPPGANSIGSVVNAAGSNDIGTVTIHSIPTGANAIGTVAVSTIQGALPTGANAIGTVAVSSIQGALPTGTNAIGSVAVTSIQTQLPAGSNNIGSVNVWSNRNLYGSQQTSVYNSTSTTTIVTAGAAGVFNDIYGLTLTNFAGAAVKVRISDSDSGNATIQVWEIPSNDTRGFMLNPLGAWPQTTSAKAWTAQTLASSSVDISVLYVKRT